MTEDNSPAAIQPVFSTEFEVRLWKMIQSAENVDGAERREKIREDIMSRLKSFDGTLASPILCALIRLAAESGQEDSRKEIDRLISLSRPRDCHPALEAASIMADNDSLNSAQAYLDAVNESQDVAAACRTRAKILMAGGKTGDAAMNLESAIRSDPLDRESYAILQKLSSDRNWLAIYACERIHAGADGAYVPPLNPAGSDTELYRIYHEWSDARSAGGSAGLEASARALEQLRSQDGYARRSMEFVLADARFSLAAGDIGHAWDAYDELADCARSSAAILCECAEARLCGDAPDAQAAVVLYRSAESADPGNPVVHRGLIKAYIAAGKPEEAVNVARGFIGSENATRKDFEDASHLFFDNGAVDDASRAAHSLNLTFNGSITANIILSKVSCVQGDLDSALNYAYAAVRGSRRDSESSICLAEVLLKRRRIASATRIARRVAEKDPGSMPALICLADCYASAGKHQMSEEMCRKALAIDPENEDARRRLDGYTMDRIGKGHIPDGSEAADALDPVLVLRGHIANGEFDEAARLIAENDAACRSSPDYRRLKGNVEFARGEYTKASASFASAAVDNPSSAAVWHSKGLADEMSGDLTSALESFDKAVLLEFSNPRLWISRGCILERIKDHAGAIDSYNRAIELDPSAPFPLIRKALILADHGHYSEALAFVDMARSVMPDSGATDTIRIRICLEAGRFDEVIEMGSRMLEAGDGCAAIPFIVRARMGLGDAEAARRTLEDALADHPEDRELLLAARDLYASVRDLPSLLSTCHKLISLFPDDRRSMRMLADGLQRARRNEEARQIYKELESLERSPSVVRTDPESAYSVAQSLLQLGDIAGASRKIDEILDLAPDNEDYILFRAKVFLQTKDVDSAENVLAGFVNRNPDSVPVLEALGDLRSSKGLWSDALDSYSKCLSIVSDRSNGMFRAHMLSKMAEMETRLGNNPDAIEHYSKALSLNPDDTRSAQSLASLHLLSGSNREALKVIVDSLERSDNPTSYSILMQVYQAMGRTDMVRDALTRFRCFDNPSEADTLRVMRTLNEADLPDEAAALKRESERPAGGIADVDPSVKRCAERLMRRAYMQGRKIDDPEIRDIGDADSDLAVKAVKYIRDIPTYEVIIPGTHDFERMETLSYNIVSVPRSPGLELLTPETAYIAGHARDVDEAKRLVAYVRSAKTSPIQNVPEGIKRFAEAYPSSDVPLETIMRDCGCGIMTARIIQSCIDKVAEIPKERVSSP